jgi:uncharacterized protein
MPGVFKTVIGAVVALCAYAAPIAAQIELPVLTRPVIDKTATLSAQEITTLEIDIRAVEAEKGSQIVVLLVSSTAPETIEQFGIRLADEWKVGRKGIDDGAILIVAKDDRTVRIEVGYGLEGAIPDAVAKRIIEERILPQFRSGNFFGGIREGVEALGLLIRGEPLPAPTQTASTDDAHQIGFTLLLFVGIVVCAVIAGKLGRVGGALVGSTLMGLIAIPLLGLVSALFLTALLLMVGLGPQGHGGSRRGGSWSSGRSGGGFGGGGFSGGGGSFGGGGASGRW